MEISENKSLISTGGSNLAKTEKLLAITKKILSEIKPQYDSIKIGNQEWMTRNLDVDRFRNGDFIPHIESDKEWEKAGEKAQPAWCYYDNNPENGNKYGKLYNWYAVNDSRGLAPEGWHVPSDDEWTSLVEYLNGKDIAGHKMKSFEGWEEWEDNYGEIHGNGDNSSGFNAFPGGYRSDDDSFNLVRSTAFFWSATENDGSNAWNRYLSHGNGIVRRGIYGNYDLNKSVGASVRCLRDDYLSI
jgi:uncharacterized protein (TIGR02145 family)